VVSHELTVGVLPFHDFELLDVFGPLEMYGTRPDIFSIHLIAENIGAVRSKQGPKVVAEYDLSSEKHYDIVMIPGGMGTRKEVENADLLAWIVKQSEDARYVVSVCTGSALLARAGLLDGIRATTNKKAFEWVASEGLAVQWEKEARWVEDGKYFTSSGISAGIDMTLALIAGILGRDEAEEIARYAEYEWHSDATWDPFAKLYNLV